MNCELLAGKVLMITGGTGSFGQTILKRCLETDIREVVIFSRDEKKQEDMRIEVANPKVKFCIGDVRNYDSVRQAMRGVNYVFHASALKQVPSCEFYPMEAVRTNVLGAENVLNAAVESGVERLVLLSTDKAVYPINAMGITKALAEKLLIAKARTLRSSAPTMCITRYGNVMGSRGSVIPLFIEQVKAQRPITITDPTMTRFLMSLADSVDLVLHAFANGQQGDTFIQKAPACTVADLAEAIKQIFGSQSAIRVIGSRHGEKRFESLISREEVAKSQDKGRFVRVPADHRDLNYANVVADHNLDANIAEDYTSDNTTRLNVEEVKALLRSVLKLGA
jgi:UDP-N-acetylglucosamine 4,6-dehydratase/5-epimerase